MAEVFGQRIQTTVRQEYLPYVVDTVLNSNVGFQRIVRAAKEWSGRTLRVPVKVSKNQTGQSFRGLQTFSTSATDNRQFMEFVPSFYQITVALPGDELSVADTDAKILDLMKLTIQSDTEDMADNLGTMFYGTTMDNSTSDFNGLSAYVDDGTVASTVGGLSKSSFPTLKGVNTDAGGTLTLAAMDTMWSSVTSGKQKPTVILATEQAFNYYGQLLRPQERINKDAGGVKGLRGGTGFVGLDYRGVPVLQDEKAQWNLAPALSEPNTGLPIASNNVMYFLNEDFIDFHALPMYGTQPVSYKSQIEGNDYPAPMGLGFSWSDWIKPANAYGFVGHIYFGGQLIVTNPKRQGVLYNIDGV